MTPQLWVGFGVGFVTASYLWAGYIFSKGLIGSLMKRGMVRHQQLLTMLTVFFWPAFWFVGKLVFSAMQEKKP